MEQFVLRGSGADGWAGARPAEGMVNAAESGEGFRPGGPAVPHDLLYHKMNGLRAAPPAPNGTAGRPAQSDDWHEDAGVSRKRRWSEADDERLRRLWHSNHSLEEIAEAMGRTTPRSEQHTSELQSLMRISYALFCLKKKNHRRTRIHTRPKPNSHYSN